MLRVGSNALGAAVLLLARWVTVEGAGHGGAVSEGLIAAHPRPELRLVTQRKAVDRRPGGATATELSLMPGWCSF
jgi:hypothetical protein